MQVLFLSVEDLEKAEYIREGSKNLLKTEFGIGDTIALCGKLERVEDTDYGPRFWINDNKEIGIIAGTFNKKVRNDAEKISEEFKAKQESKKFYLLLYGNPYYRDKLYINVNQENGVLLVSENTYKKFHEMREKSNTFLSEKLGLRKVEVKEEKEKLSIEDILKFLKKNSGRAEIDKIEGHFSKLDRKLVDKKILELLESGKAYEPKAGMIELLG